jgi:hypothetical protein
MLHPEVKEALEINEHDTPLPLTPGLIFCIASEAPHGDE